MTPIKRGTARRMGLAHPEDHVSVHVLPDLARLGESLRAAMARARTAPPIDWSGLSIAAHRRQLEERADG